MKNKISTSNAPNAVGPYNQGIVYNNLIFISGQIPFDKDGNFAGSDISDQTKQCLRNIGEIVKEVGGDKSSILKITIFLKDMGNFDRVNKAYSDFFEGTVFPARSTIEVSRIPKDVDIEIEAIAGL